MRGLIKKGLAALNKREHNLALDSYFRDAYPFRFRGRKYVIKEDYCPYSEGGCFSEWIAWKEKCSEEKFRRWFVPTLAAGQIDNPERDPEPDVCNWLIMPWRQPLADVSRRTRVDDKIEYLQDKIYYDFKRDFPKTAQWYDDRIALIGLSLDLHHGNWGMTNRGLWQAYDYAGD